MSGKSTTRKGNERASLFMVNGVRRTVYEYDPGYVPAQPVSVTTGKVVGTDIAIFQYNPAGSELYARSGR